ncbi:non-catalytic subunit of ribonuclease H2 [Chloropicon primus]|uniref:Uncharacterized protein n=1 Tax=Chloropicon primus TaxID=1764295 RepID=A0A5B8MMJ0_9CHLO|nr:hypothetical protein A3770_04p30380 [Chloropicon primus]UPQ99730.1 non-catalytic subunit of ribonuclease H2 [Chloropicon primus]|mmetsp:Transcript_13438/g.37759  ORF Transcript_13438/g.37759 Transcript_13438/m.37759 type:complete len:144 (+) Transcript_13438:95-526(+)|eukprot:QDZ20520.1 hypothetical protein A3770_04p30380 [Chloropicon primus]
MATGYEERAGRKREMDLTSCSREGEGREVHWLPCGIDYDGEAKGMEEHFRSSVVTTKEGTKEAYLRGRHLKGTELPLPQGYSAVVLEKRHEGGDFQEGSKSSWEAVGGSPCITYWNHTTNPSETDAQRRALEFLDMNEALNGE